MTRFSLLPPSNGSPSMRPSKSIVIRSPSLQARATSFQTGRCWRRLSIIVSTSRIRHGGGRARELDAAHVLQFDLRIDLEGRGVAQVIGLAGLLRLDARPAGGLQFFLAQRLRESFADQVGDDLLAHFAAVVLANDVDRRLARPESLDARRAAHLEQPRVDLLAHAGRGHRHLEAAFESR